MKSLCVNVYTTYNVKRHSHFTSFNGTLYLSYLNYSMAIIIVEIDANINTTDEVRYIVGSFGV